MGIIAYCPSGHRMKVKDHLAGRRGICPTCGARFRIPQASTPAVPLGRQVSPVVAGQQMLAEPVVPAADGIVTAAAAAASVVSLDPADATGLPEVLMLAMTAPASPPVEEPMRVEEPPLVDPDPTADLAVEPEDDETGSTQFFWYVAMPGGQPSAAMKEAEMLDWLDSPLATGREVVWRSDWPGWKPIAEAFPDRFPPAFPGMGGW